MGNHSNADQTTQRVFTLAEAQRALPLVRRIVTEIVADYRELLELAQYRDERLGRGELRAATGMEQRSQQLTNQVNERTLELREVGCELRDWENGVVDFRSLRGEREIYLCWKLGEAAITHWHELFAGDSTRRPLGESLTDANQDAHTMQRPIAGATG